MLLLLYVVSGVCWLQASSQPPLGHGPGQGRGLRCSSQCGCLGVMVDCSKRGLLEVPRDLPPWVEILELKGNEIKDLGDGTAFAHLEKLKRLDLSNNLLEYVLEGQLSSLPMLQDLKLDGNRLQVVPELSNLSSLTSLSLKANLLRDLHSLPKNLPSHANLQLLDVSHNKLTYLSRSQLAVSSLAHISTLRLTGNEIGHIESGSLNLMTELRVFKVNKNQLTYLPPGNRTMGLFTHSTNLRLLDLSRNKLQHVYGLSFQGAIGLQRLRLRDNNIQHLDDGAFFGLPNLKQLQLDHNNITVVSKGWLYGMGSLEKLLLSSNKITVLDTLGFSSTPQLRFLDLSENIISHLPAGTFESLSVLRVLRLDHNIISNIHTHAFRGLDRLKSLSMSSSHVGWLIEDSPHDSVFSSLPSLLRLHLSDNQIKVISRRAFLGLASVRELDLSHNQVQAIERRAFSPLTNILQIHLNSSSVVCDCDLSWLVSWLHATSLPSVSLRCSHPLWLVGRALERLDVANLSCEEYAKPHITLHPRSVEALAGANLTLRCEASSTSSSPMHFKWKKDGVDIEDGDLVNTAETVDGSLTQYSSHLHLEAVAKGVEGRYQCVCTNIHGVAYSSKAKLQVYIFPSFTQLPSDVVVRVGETARLECGAKGQPKPLVAWQKDGGDDFPAARERRMHFMQQDDSVFISASKLVDAGTYTCTATNAAGTIRADASIQVLSLPRFSKDMADTESKLGETTVLECMASDQEALLDHSYHTAAALSLPSSRVSPRPDDLPPPHFHISWYKDGQVMGPGDSSRHMFTADNQLLIIMHTEAADAGTYGCQIENAVGSHRTEATLTVLPAAHSDMLRDAGVSGSWSDSEMQMSLIVVGVVCSLILITLLVLFLLYRARLARATQRHARRKSNVMRHLDSLPRFELAGGDDSEEGGSSQGSSDLSCLPAHARPPLRAHQQPHPYYYSRTFHPQSHAPPHLPQNHHHELYQLHHSPHRHLGQEVSGGSSSSSGVDVEYSSDGDVAPCDAPRQSSSLSSSSSSQHNLDLNHSYSSVHHVDRHRRKSTGSKCNITVNEMENLHVGTGSLPER